MNNISFTFDGRILEELSTQIPSDVFALNELIKNSSDAKAESIVIQLNTREKILVVDDDGLGMGESEIKELFNISHSSKSYGKLDEQTGRYIQGSKGLGFLSAFRFGTEVTWDTVRDGVQRSFTIKRDEAMKQHDLSKLPIQINENETNASHKTTITIKLDDQSCTNLEQKFNNAKICSRLIYSFLPGDERRSWKYSDIKIRIEMNGKIIAERNTPELHISTILPEMQRAEIRYDSEKSNDAIVYCDGKKYTSISFEKPEQFSVSIHLVYFKNVRKNHSTGKQIPALFKPEDDSSPTIPQIYINENLFDSISLFDPQINRSRRNTETASQFIGYINVYSPNIHFNPDRTQLTETPLNKTIKEFLESLNKTLQKNIAKIPPSPDNKKQSFENKEDNTEETENPITREEENETRQPLKKKESVETLETVNSPSPQKSPQELLLHAFTNRTLPLEIKSRSLRYPLIKLIQQINQLGKNNKLELVACGLRIFFELPIARLTNYQGKSQAVKILKQNIVRDKSLQDKVSTILSLIREGTGGNAKGNIPRLTKKAATQLRNGIAQSLGNPNGIKNSITLSDIQKIADAAEKSNLGMHAGSAQLTDSDIKEIAHSASKFAAIIDALLQP